MKYFQHKPLLHKFSHVDEFLKEFSLTKEDFILASRSTWKRWFAPFLLRFISRMNTDAANRRTA